MDIRHAVGVKAGVPAEKLANFLSYRDNPHFSEREQAALEFCERTTRDDLEVTNECLARVRGHFSEPELVELTSSPDEEKCLAITELSSQSGALGRAIFSSQPTWLGHGLNRRNAERQSAFPVPRAALTEHAPERSGPLWKFQRRSGLAAPMMGGTGDGLASANGTPSRPSTAQPRCLVAVETARRDRRCKPRDLNGTGGSNTAGYSMWSNC